MYVCVYIRKLYSVCACAWKCVEVSVHLVCPVAVIREHVNYVLFNVRTAFISSHAV